MTASNLPKLSKRERQIMDIIYRDGPINAQEVMERMEDPPGYATVRKLLGILEQKGQLKHTKSGRQYIYAATASKEKVKKNSLNHLLKTFFKGSMTEAVATFLDESDQNLSNEELDELESIIRRAKEKRNQGE